MTALVLLAGARVVVATGPVTQMVYGNDAFVLLDGAWRVLQGQRPHVDFNTSLGFGIFVIVAAGLKVFGHSVEALPPTLASLGVIAGAWCWLVTAPRLRSAPWLASALSLVAGTFTYSAYFLDDVPVGASYVGAYNHGSHALLVILAADVMLRVDGASRWREVAYGASSGLILGVFAITKQTFLLPSAVLLVIAASHLRRGRAWWRSLAAMLGAVLLASTVYLRGDLLSVARDFLFVARARGHTVGRSEHAPFIYLMSHRGLNVDAGKIFEVLRLESSRLAAFTLACAVRVYPFDGLLRSPARRDDRRDLVAVAAVLASSLGVLLTSWHWAYLPATALLCVALAQAQREGATPLPSPDARRLRALVMQFLALAVCADLVGKSAFAMAIARSARGYRDDPATAIDAPATRGMQVWRAGYCEPDTFGARMTDGVAVLRGARDQRGTIFVMDFVNPFSFALRRRSPRGDAVSWSMRASFNERVYLLAEQVFHDVDLVMVPRCPLEPWTTELMARIYRDTLDRDFMRESETRYWTLLSRRAPRGVARAVARPPKPHR
ncbi:MAG: hypothetical protein U0326_38940 [Polyangiales bacterium]